MLGHFLMLALLLGACAIRADDSPPPLPPPPVDSAEPTFKVKNADKNVIYTEEGPVLKLARTLPIGGARAQKARETLWKLIGGKKVHASFEKSGKPPFEAEVTLLDGRNVSDEAGKLMAVTVFGAGPPSGSTASTPSLGNVISSEQLLKEYSENEIAAEQKYKGVEVTISGLAGDVKKGLFGSGTYTTLEGSGFFSVQCFFDGDDVEPLGRVRKGSKITVTGTVEGKMGNVLVKHCKLR